ncbi:DnaA ATPase domain-containing protein [Halobacteriovorax sp. HLS]|uniref:DnaA/Hda family protein n=1 Tax=Halobacteriovorax sp. HLS TaxID=2234000 RepID=UPI000FDAA494|nr:DnaA/Hda family protein [Halobacteriovorax sp. HLS]
MSKKTTITKLPRVRPVTSSSASKQLDLLTFVSNDSLNVSTLNKVRRISSARSPKPVNKSRANTLPLSVDRSKTFKNFISGESNQRARECVRRLFESPNDGASVIYINALSGLGKSHLLYACANELFAKYDSPIRYFHGKEFIYGPSPKEESIPSVVFIDDIDEITSDSGIQNEFCRRFDYLKRSGVKIVMAGSILPKNMKMAIPKYSSRVGGALVEKICKIDRDLALKIIDNLVILNRFELSNDVKELLADCFHYHVYGLESAVLKLKSYSDTFGKAVDIKTALEELKLLGPVLDSQINSKKIILRVCELYKVEFEEIFSRNRKKECAFARHLCMYILRERNGLSLARIATLFNRDHTSVIYGINKIIATIESDSSLKKTIHDIV